jgi:hypothetical protein
MKFNFEKNTVFFKQVKETIKKMAFDTIDSRKDQIAKDLFAKVEKHQ